MLYPPELRGREPVRTSLPVRDSYTKAGVFARGFACRGESRRPDAWLAFPAGSFSRGTGRQIFPSLAPFLLIFRGVGA